MFISKYISYAEFREIGYVSKFQSAYSIFWDCQREQRPVFLAILSTVSCLNAHFHFVPVPSPSQREVFTVQQTVKGLTVEQSGNIWHNDGGKSLLTTSVWKTPAFCFPLQWDSNYWKMLNVTPTASLSNTLMKPKCVGLQLELRAKYRRASANWILVLRLAALLHKRTFNQLDTCYFKQSLRYNDTMLLVTVVTHHQTSQSSWNYMFRLKPKLGFEFPLCW